jgi:ribosomal protein L37E
MSGRSNADIAAARWRTVWRRHDDGAAQRAIAREIGISLSSVQSYLAKGRPADVPPRPTIRPTISPVVGRRSGSADLIVPGSVREERSEHVVTLRTVQCGRCGHQQDTFGTHTSTCKACGRTMRLDQPSRENVVPMRRTS